MFTLSDPAAGISIRGFSGLVVRGFEALPFQMFVSGAATASLQGHGSVIIYWAIEPLTQVT